MPIFNSYMHNFQLVCVATCSHFGSQTFIPLPKGIGVGFTSKTGIEEKCCGMEKKFSPECNTS